MSKYRSYKKSKTYKKPVRTFYKKKSTVSKKRTYKKSNSKISKLTKKVDKVVKSNNATLATHVYRSRSTFNILSSANEQDYDGIAAIRLTSIETALANLKYYDPSTPGTLITADGSTGTYSRVYNFARNISTLYIRNNYQSPVHLSIYGCKPKEDTSITPIAAFTSGLTDVGAPNPHSPLTYITDSKQFLDLWSIDMSKKLLLQPGSHCKIFKNLGQFLYDPSLTDSHALEYQAKFRAYYWAVFLTGVVGHDSVQDDQGILRAGIDLHRDLTYTIQYDAGVKLKTIEVDDDSATFTNFGLVSLKPVSDNLPYSLG